MIISNLYTRFSLIPLLMSSVILSGACDNSDNPRVAAAGKQAREHVVEVTPAAMETVQSRLTASGTIEAGTRVRLYNEVSGKIRYLPYYEGDAVAAQTIVIGLDDEVIQAELDMSEPKS